MTATVNPGSAFSLGAQRTLFAAGALLRSPTHRAYEVAPDDRRFVFTRLVGSQEEAGPVSLIQVENWLAEVQGAGSRRR